MKQSEPSQTSPEARSDHDRLIQRLLSDRKKAEAMQWLRGGDGVTERTVGACKTNFESLQFVQEIYNLGALEVFAIHIHRKGKRSGLRTGKLVATLPADPLGRKAIFDWCKERGESLGFTPDPDRGESHVFLLLD